VPIDGTPTVLNAAQPDAVAVARAMTSLDFGQPYRLISELFT
jgi:hypothetical protein